MKYYSKNLKYAHITFGANLSYFMETERITIGRNSAEGEVDVDVGPHAFVSRRHLEVIYSFSRLRLKCIGKNGIFINDFFKAHSSIPYELPSKCVLRFPSTNVQVTVRQLEGCTNESDEIQSDDCLNIKSEDDEEEEDYLLTKISQSNKSTSKASSLNNINLSSPSKLSKVAKGNFETLDNIIISDDSPNNPTATNIINQHHTSALVAMRTKDCLLTSNINSNDSNNNIQSATASSRLLSSSSNNMKLESFPIRNNNNNINTNNATNNTNNNFTSVSRQIKFESINDKPNIPKIVLKPHSYRPYNSSNIIYSNSTNQLVGSLMDSNNRRPLTHTQHHISIERGTDTQKPPYSYAQLIVQAVSTSRDRQLTLSGIYNYITKHYPYFKSHDKGWQNSVRHNLSLNRYFIKVPRSQDEPGKGSFWKIDSAYEHKLFNQAFRKRRLRHHQQHQTTLSSQQSHQHLHHNNNNNNNNNHNMNGSNNSGNTHLMLTDMSNESNSNKLFTRQQYNSHHNHPSNNNNNTSNKSLGQRSTVINGIYTLKRRNPTDEYDDEHMQSPTYIIKRVPTTHSNVTLSNNHPIKVTGTINNTKLRNVNYNSNTITGTTNSSVFHQSNAFECNHINNTSTNNNNNGTGNNNTSQSYINIGGRLYPATSVRSVKLVAISPNNNNSNTVSNTTSISTDKSCFSSSAESSVFFPPSSSDYSSPPLSPPTMDHYVHHNLNQHNHHYHHQQHNQINITSPNITAHLLTDETDLQNIDIEVDQFLNDPYPLLCGEDEEEEEDNDGCGSSNIINNHSNHNNNIGRNINIINSKDDDVDDDSHNNSIDYLEYRSSNVTLWNHHDVGNSHSNDIEI